jgi:hypothetical protein
MKISFKTVAGLAIPFAILMIAFRSFMTGRLAAPVIFTGLISGLLFGLTFTIFVNFFKAKVLKNIIVELHPNEKVVMENGANHFKGVEGVGGKLVLTDKRLIFKSHPMNVQNHESSFDLTEIKNLSATKTLKVLKNGLKLDLANNESHRFIVDDPSAWVAAMNSVKKLNVF